MIFFFFFFIVALLVVFCKASFEAAPYELKTWYEMYKFEFEHVPANERQFAPRSLKTLMMDIDSFAKHVAGPDAAKNWKTPVHSPGTTDFNMDMNEAQCIRTANHISFQKDRIVKGIMGNFQGNWFDLWERVTEVAQDTRARAELDKNRLPPGVERTQKEASINAGSTKISEAAESAKWARLKDIEVHRIPALKAQYHTGDGQYNIKTIKNKLMPGGYVIPESLDPGATMKASPALQKPDKSWETNRKEFNARIAGGYEILHGLPDNYPKDGHWSGYERVQNAAKRLKQPIHKDTVCPRARLVPKPPTK